ncbi:hypothetical protein JTB14_026593 [Gonioctena quinquepunctata]|nr:hypothetical protein JTB14_026593 [Gonioctena quinquepunctata]
MIVEWLLKRNKFPHVNLLEELRLYPDDWRNFLRMDENTYLELLNLFTPLILRNDTNAHHTQRKVNSPIKFPKTEEAWKAIAKYFEVEWHFPHCLGALDGKHVRITPPSNSVDFGTIGGISDGGVLTNTTLYRKFKTKH